MPGLYLALLLVVIAINLVAAAVGGLDWYRNRVSIGFWYLLRAAQLATLAFVLGECVLYVIGDRADDQLHYLYVFLPVAVSFLAEGMRAGAASQELEGTDHRTLSDAEQEKVAMAIMHRETGIMATGALVTAFLVWRALATTSGMF